MSNTVPASIRVVREVAAREGVDPTDLEPPLHEVVDPDALDALFRPRDDASEHATTVEFTYRGHRVRVHGPGTVDVNAPADRHGSTAVELER
jgi:hypothetical protein